MSKPMTEARLSEIEAALKQVRENISKEYDPITMAIHKATIEPMLEGFDEFISEVRAYIAAQKPKPRWEVWCSGGLYPIAHCSDELKADYIRDVLNKIGTFPGTYEVREVR